ncbi:ABC transporter ATP-binding protein [Enemella sp. A6]|uniref:ABC transporter ATP-binding protein n=1 Tax=Enemella sp. A6 TaxID=3440152 RepID=UPI003EBC8359
MSHLLTCTELSISAPDGRCLISDFNLTLGEGERIAIMGPSGIGKTTILRAVLGELPSGFTTDGSLVLDGQKRTVAYVPQDAGESLTPSMRVGATLREAAALDASATADVIGDVLHTVDLPSDRSFLRRRTWQLSGGQQRRVALARALAMNRPLLILDEPTAGLDPKTRAHMLSVLADLSKGLRSALLLVTHDRAAAVALGCRIIDLAETSVTTSEIDQPPRPSLDGLSTFRSAEPALAVRGGYFVDPRGRTILDQVDLELHPDTITALRGVSGGGKTSIARALVGFLPLRSGTLTLHGTRLAPTLWDRTIQQRRAIQLVAQSPHDAFNPWRTIRSSLADANPSCDPGSFLAELGLSEELMDRRPSQLSGGQRQRFSILRALSVEPDVLVLDEPTSALDPVSVVRVMKCLRTVAEQGAAILVVTHQEPGEGSSLAEAFSFDRTWTLDDGSLNESVEPPPQ